MILASIAFLLLQGLAVDSSPARPIQQLVHTRWTPDDGTPSDINALARTSDGYLWLATASGLYRFDGARFTHFIPQTGDTLPSARPGRMLATRDGSLWITWFTVGVSRLQNGRLTTYGTTDGLPRVFSLTESSTGTLVAGTANGLVQFVGGAWKDVGRQWGYPGVETQAVWFDRGDALWAETKDRVVYLPAGAQRFVDPGNHLRSDAANADFAEMADGTIWMAELGRSVHTLRRVGDTSPISEVQVGAYAQLIDRKGSLWVGSLGDGLRRVIDPSRTRGRQIAQFGPEAERFTEQDGLLSDVLLALLEDAEGTIWVASARGLESFREGAFTTSSTPGGSRPRAVLAGRDSSVLVVGFNVPWIVRLHPDGRDSISIAFNTPLTSDLSGKLWTVHGGEVLRQQGGSFTPIPLRRSKAHRLTSILFDRDGTAWLFDGDLGLLRLTGGGLERVAPLADSAHSSATLFRDDQGRIWVGQNERVAIQDHGRLTLHDLAPGTGPVEALYQDRSGQVWVASRGGVTRFGAGEVRSRTLTREIPGGTVFGIAEDAGGAMWFVTRIGVVRVPPGELDHALADSAYPISFRIFDRHDGLPGGITPWNVGPWMAQTADGRIWIGTDSAVSSLDPRRLPAALPPRVLIEAVRIDSSEQLPSEVAVVPARTTDLEIDYTAPSPSNADRLRFRYRLEGAEPDWHAVGTRRQAFFTGLAPGEYRFQVMVSDGNGVWSEAAASWSFRVLPAWHQTLLFRGAVVLLIAGMGAAAAAVIQRRRHLLAHETLRGRYEATMAERARIAQDLHDTLLQGFTGITIQLHAILRSLKRQPEAGAAALERVLESARTALQDARHMIWDMRAVELEGRDLADALEAASRSAVEAMAIPLSFTVTGDRRRLPPAVETAALRIGREAIFNAIKHARPTQVAITLEFAPTALILQIRDDGIGIGSEALALARAGEHLGLAGMRHRAEQLGGRLDISSSLGGGTVVQVKLPIDGPNPATSS